MPEAGEEDSAAKLNNLHNGNAALKTDSTYNFVFREMIKTVVISLYRVTENCDLHDLRWGNILTLLSSVLLSCAGFI